ncbi:hypothetical protein ABEF95_002993 [Exophiala dermatitidis]
MLLPNSVAKKAALALLMVDAVLGDPLATVDPCPGADKLSLAPITVTAQYQPVSTCQPTTACVKGKCSTAYPFTTYPWVSTVVPYAWNGTTSQSTTVTAVDATLVVSEHLETLTTITAAPTANKRSWADWSNKKPEQDTTTIYETVSRRALVPFKEAGPLCIPGWEGSGLCKKCQKQPDGSRYQLVDVVECRSGTSKSGKEWKRCSEWYETVIERPAPTSTVTASALCSSKGSVPSAGTYTWTFPQTAPPVTITAPPRTVTVTIHGEKTISVEEEHVYTIPGKSWDACVTKSFSKATTFNFNIEITKVIIFEIPRSTQPAKSSHVIPVPTGSNSGHGWWPLPDTDNNGQPNYGGGKGWADWTPAPVPSTTSTDTTGPIGFTTSSSSLVTSTTTAVDSPIMFTTTSTTTSSGGDTGPIGQGTTTTSTTSMGTGDDGIGQSRTTSSLTTTSSTSNGGDTGPIGGSATTTSSTTSGGDTGPIGASTTTTASSTTSGGDTGPIGASTTTTASSTSSGGDTGPIGGSTTATSSTSTSSGNGVGPIGGSTTASSSSTTSSGNGVGPIGGSTTASSSSATSSGNGVGPIGGSTTASSSSTTSSGNGVGPIGGSTTATSSTSTSSGDNVGPIGGSTTGASSLTSTSSSSAPATTTSGSAPICNLNANICLDSQLVTANVVSTVTCPLLGGLLCTVNDLLNLVPTLLGGNPNVASVLIGNNEVIGLSITPEEVNAAINAGGLNALCGVLPTVSVIINDPTCPIGGGQTTTTSALTTTTSEVTTTTSALATTTPALTTTTASTTSSGPATTTTSSAPICNLNANICLDSQLVTANVVSTVTCPLLGGLLCSVNDLLNLVPTLLGGNPNVASVLIGNNEVLGLSITPEQLAAAINAGGLNQICGALPTVSVIINDPTCPTNPSQSSTTTSSTSSALTSTTLSTTQVTTSFLTTTSSSTTSAPATTTTAAGPVCNINANICLDSQLITANTVVTEACPLLSGLVCTVNDLLSLVPGILGGNPNVASVLVENNQIIGLSITPEQLQAAINAGELNTVCSALGTTTVTIFDPTCPDVPSGQTTTSSTTAAAVSTTLATSTTSLSQVTTTTSSAAATSTTAALQCGIQVTLCAGQTLADVGLSTVTCDLGVGLLCDLTQTLESVLNACVGTCGVIGRTGLLGVNLEGLVGNTDIAAIQAAVGAVPNCVPSGPTLDLSDPGCPSTLFRRSAIARPRRY